MLNSNKNKHFKICLKNIKSSEKKVRAFTKNLIGKQIKKILLILSVQTHKISVLISKAIYSILQNVKKNNFNIKDLYIKSIEVNKGKVYKKIFTRSQGRVNYIKKKTSHIYITIV